MTGTAHITLRALPLLLAALAAAGCASGSGTLAPRPFKLGYLAKSDVDMVADVHLRSSFNLLRQLAIKLYRRNPAEWRRSGAPTLRARVDALFTDPLSWAHLGLGGRRGTDAVLLTFDPAFGGDRVAAYVAGLSSMIYAAYGNRPEFFLLDELEPQKLYNSARNVEIAAWKLRTARRPDGTPWLLSTSLDEDDPNLSFERLFGKLIATQDLIARVVSEQSNRAIKGVVQQMAQAVFLPI